MVPTVYLGTWIQPRHVVQEEQKILLNTYHEKLTFWRTLSIQFLSMHHETSVCLSRKLEWEKLLTARGGANVDIILIFTRLQMQLEQHCVKRLCCNCNFEDNIACYPLPHRIVVVLFSLVAV